MDVTYIINFAKNHVKIVIIFLGKMFLNMFGIAATQIINCAVNFKNWFLEKRRIKTYFESLSLRDFLYFYFIKLFFMTYVFISNIIIENIFFKHLINIWPNRCNAIVLV